MTTLSQTASVSPAEIRKARPAPRPPAAEPPEAPRAAAPEEVLVRDARSGLSPSQMVERKLLTLLNGRPMPVSHVLLASARRPARSAGP